MRAVGWAKRREAARAHVVGSARAGAQARAFAHPTRGGQVAAASFFQWGLAGDVPIVGDFDGDGKTELTVFRGPTGQWFIRYSSQDYDVNTHDVFQWGLPGDVPIKP